MSYEIPPLAGVTVVDLTVNIAGPFASMVLRDLGARVIKVEPPHGDDSRDWPPFTEDGAGTPFVAFNRGKESVAIDAKHPEGRDLVHRLAAGADVFLESLRPGKADALGLGWEDLRQVNPSLVYCSVNAFGDTGPLAATGGFDAIVQAYSGIMDLTGDPDGDPCRVGAAVLDVGTGMWAAMSVLAALRVPAERRGGRVQATLLGTAVGYLMHHLVAARVTGEAPRRLGTAQHNFAPYQGIHARDGVVMVGVNSDRMWTRFCAAIDAPELAEDPRFTRNSDRLAHRTELVDAIERRTRQMSAEELRKRLDSHAIAAAPVRRVSDLIDDPQMEALRLWGATPDGLGVPRIPMAGADDEVGAVPRVGEHSWAVLASLGLGAERIERLIDDGVVAAG